MKEIKTYKLVRWKPSNLPTLLHSDRFTQIPQSLHTQNVLQWGDPSRQGQANMGEPSRGKEVIFSCARGVTIPALHTYPCCSALLGFTQTQKGPSSAHGGGKGSLSSTISSQIRLAVGVICQFPPTLCKGGAWEDRSLLTQSSLCSAQSSKQCSCSGSAPQGSGSLLALPHGILCPYWPTSTSTLLLNCTFASSTTIKRGDPIFFPTLPHCLAFSFLLLSTIIWMKIK